MKVVDVVQGFLGSGKTTLINNLIQEVFTLEKILVLQTEWGEAEINGCGNRVILRNWDWERGFNLLEIRKLLRIPGVERIIIELNGMAPADKLLSTLGIMGSRGEIKLGNCMAVFHGPTWEVMGKPLEEIFQQMALSSQGFWVRDGNKDLHRWLQSVQSNACLTTGENWGLWYKQIDQANRHSLAINLVKLGSIVLGMYLFYWLIIKEII